MSAVTTAKPSLLEQARALITPLNLHFAGVAALVLVNLYLLVHMGLAWRSASTKDAAAIAQQNSQLEAASKAAEPLRGLDGKLANATKSADAFYRRRLPYADSQVIAELGALAKKENVKLTRVQYAESPVLEGAVGEATELRMDASLTGEYRSLVQYLNNLERDKQFFLITAVSLTGQQSGTVNLRIKLTTYLRAPMGDESKTAAPVLDVPVVKEAAQ